MKVSPHIIYCLIACSVLHITSLQAQMLHNVYNRKTTLLNGKWHYIIDPYETGYRNHRNWTPFDVKDYNKASAKPYYTNRQMDNRWDRIEYNFPQSETLNVPSDWNSQDDRLLYYEGALWYYKNFNYTLTEGNRLFIYFGASNYETNVYINGEKLGTHFGGFNPFSFEITNLVKPENNDLVVLVDNKRELNNVPNLTTDWWNYGGLTRDVELVEMPSSFIDKYHIQLERNRQNTITASVQLNGKQFPQTIKLSIPELNIFREIPVDKDGLGQIQIESNKIKRWYPERPKLYQVKLEAGKDTIVDEIGFRTIETRGSEILLNGRSIFLRGISLHEEIPQDMRRAHSLEDAKRLLGWAKELNCNFVRLAHYPHNENMPRLADQLGLLLWEEIPVYWGINYKNPDAYQQAENQLKSLINRDINRASVIVWSIANETPVIDSRTKFLKKLKLVALELDSNRLVSAALERHNDKVSNVLTIQDPFANEVDLLSCNEYIGWYGSLPQECQNVTWSVPVDKPFFISEFGAGALYGHRGDSLTRWTEDYQKYLYTMQIEMLRKVPTLRGMTPWILADFRSPRRNLPKIQDGWNRKGLISNEGDKKKAFYVLKAFYDEMEKKYAYPIKD